MNSVAAAKILDCPLATEHGSEIIDDAKPVWRELRIEPIQQLKGAAIMMQAPPRQMPVSTKSPGFVRAGRAPSGQESTICRALPSTVRPNQSASAPRKPPLFHRHVRHPLAPLGLIHDDGIIGTNKIAITTCHIPTYIMTVEYSLNCYFANRDIRFRCCSTEFDEYPMRPKQRRALSRFDAELLPGIWPPRRLGY